MWNLELIMVVGGCPTSGLWASATAPIVYGSPAVGGGGGGAPSEALNRTTYYSTASV